MAREIKFDPSQPGIVADRDLYLADDEHSVVEKGDAKARFLLAARGSFIEPHIVQRYGLSAKGGKVEQGEAEDGDESVVGGPAGRVNEGQIRAPGEPLILAPRTGVMRPEPAPRVIPELGQEVAPKDLVPPIAVSNVPAEDDAYRAKVAEETAGEGEEDEGKKAAAKKQARKRSR